MVGSFAIGKMKDRIQLQSATESANEFGEKTTIWETYATVWASIEQLSGKEYYFAQQQTGEVTARIIIRYKSGVKFGDMAVFVNDIKSITDNYEIVGIVNKENRNEWLELLCKKVAA